MGLGALTTAEDGRIIIPSTEEDWQDWVSPTATKNYVLRDPLLDWLELYAEAHGFQRDTAYPDYDARTDFTSFMTEQGRRFGEAVLRHLRALTEVVTISAGPEDMRDLPKAEETFRAMLHGAPVIYEGVLRDPEHRTYGAPDLLVRSDELCRLFPTAITPEEAVIPAPDLQGKPWHYRVIDIKFRTLGLSAKGELDNNSSAPAYKTQVFIYNRALGRVQGFEAPVSYLLGRGWSQTRKDETFRGSSCMERLGPVRQAGTVANKRPIFELEAEAAEWVRRVRKEGHRWVVLPQPSIPELYPNPTNDQDGPWRHAKKQIAEELEDLTLLWQVGAGGREKGHAAGVFRWRDPGVTPDIVGVTGKRAPTLQALLNINRSDEGTGVRPSRIRAAEEEWRRPAPVEFYVDFETVSDLADDFSRMPQKGGQTLIFMIGCGHLEGGGWRFQSFVTEALNERAEAAIIDAWLAHMEGVRQRLAPDGQEPQIIHWSPAEEATFETAYNSAKQRHNRSDWPSPRWLDFLRRVIHEEPVVVRGAMSFGLKAVAKAMHRQRLIETLWDDGPTDGLGAMVGGWWCAEEARRRGVPLIDIEFMQEIVQYNEVDCRVMMEIVSYFRAKH
jgi:predicted RecB family nuclease